MNDYENWQIYDEVLRTKVKFLNDEICILRQRFKIYFYTKVCQIKTQNLYF